MVFDLMYIDHTDSREVAYVWTIGLDREWTSSTMFGFPVQNEFAIRCIVARQKDLVSKENHILYQALEGVPEFIIVGGEKYTKTLDLNIDTKLVVYKNKYGWCVMIADLGESPLDRILVEVQKTKIHIK